MKYVKLNIIILIIATILICILRPKMHKLAVLVDSDVVFQQKNVTVKTKTIVNENKHIVVKNQPADIVNYPAPPKTFAQQAKQVKDRPTDYFLDDEVKPIPIQQIKKPTQPQVALNPFVPKKNWFNSS